MKKMGKMTDIGTKRERERDGECRYSARSIKTDCHSSSVTLSYESSSPIPATFDKHISSDEFRKSSEQQHNSIYFMLA